jgi:hypothetical protein
VKYASLAITWISRGKKAVVQRRQKTEDRRQKAADPRARRTAGKKHGGFIPLDTACPVKRIVSNGVKRRGAGIANKGRSFTAIGKATDMPGR